MGSSSYRARTEGSITSTKLEDFLYCQTLYRLKWIEGVNSIEDEEAEEDSDALVIGTAYDVYMQGIEKFNAEYAIVAKRTGTTGKIELTMAQGKLIRAMAQEMARQSFYNPVGQKQYHLKVKLNEAITISGTLDEFQKDKAAIIDDKTSAGIRRFQEYREKYRRQLAFYQYLVYLAYDILCDGLIRMVTKDKIPKSHFFYADAENLKAEWPRIIEGLEELERCTKANSFAPSPREKCLNCPAYSYCPHSVQKELYLL